MGVHLDFLRQVPLFRDLSDADLTKVASLAVERRYQRGQVIFAEDDVGQSMYVVKEGQVKVSRWLPSGREVILAFHPPGDYFGEMALLDGQTLPATVTAVTATTIILLGRAQFLGLVQQPPFAMALLRTLCARCRDSWQQVESLTHHHAEARIRMALHQLCVRKGVRTSEGVRIDIALTHRELGGIAGVSRETVTRVLGQLADAKLLRVEDHRLLVLVEPESLLDSSSFE
jgi:CRP/FNR family transcriptional regulator